MDLRDSTPMGYSVTDHIPKTFETVPAPEMYSRTGIQAYGLSVGPIPLSTFTGSMMRVKGGFTPHSVPKNTFAKVVVTPEPEMQALWVKAAKKAKVFRNFSLHHIANSVDPVSGILQRPDMGIYSSYDDDAPDALHWSELETLIELKPKDKHDPHVLDLELEDGDVMTENDDDDVAKHARGQILIYIGALSARQHRRYTYVVGIFGKHARVYLADPSGLSLSETIPYVADPMKLVSFFQRFEQLSDEQRGLDTTVTRADEDEVAMFEQALEALNRLASEGHPVRSIPNMAPSDLKGIPKYKIPVYDDKTQKTHYYIICRPLRYPLFPFGHFSRTFPALRVEDPENESVASDDDGDEDSVDKTLNSLFLLGDMWRFSEGAALSEMDIYDELHKAGVPHLAPLLFGGDARTEKGQPQTTIVHKLSQEEHDKESGAKGFYRLNEQTHYRFVQKIAYPINTFRNAMELVQVIRDAYESLCEAWLRADRVHRAISEQTVMISATEYTDDSKSIARGLLGGWSNSRLFSTRGASRLFRETSWQYDSVDLLQKPEKMQTIHDDCEALFWLLLHTAIHHCKHAGRVMHQMFDEWAETEGDDDCPRFTGGLNKKDFLRLPAAQALPVFECPALQCLIAQLRSYWGKLLKLRENAEDEPLKFHAAYTSFSSNPRQLLTYFDGALNKGPAEWVNGEWNADQYAQKTKKQISKSKAKKKGSSTHDKINTRTRSAATTTILHVIEEVEEGQDADEAAEVEAILKDNDGESSSDAACALETRVSNPDHLTVGQPQSSQLPIADSTGGRRNAVYGLRSHPKKTERGRAA